MPCGDLAPWVVLDIHGTPIAFFCNRHRPKGAVAVPASVVFRRVSVVACVDLAGVSMHPPLAQAEALCRLERAIDSVGGRLSLRSVSSQVGRYEPPPPPPRNKGGRGREL